MLGSRWGRTNWCSRCEENRVLLRVNSLKVSIQKFISFLCVRSEHLNMKVCARERLVRAYWMQLLNNRGSFEFMNEFINEKITRKSDQKCVRVRTFIPHHHINRLCPRITYQHFSWRADASFVLRTRSNCRKTVEFTRFPLERTKKRLANDCNPIKMQLANRKTENIGFYARSACVFSYLWSESPSIRFSFNFWCFMRTHLLALQRGKCAC